MKKPEMALALRTTEGIFSSGHSQARKAHEHFTLSVPPRELWQSHIDRLTDFKVTQPSPGSAESPFLRTFLKLGKNLRSSSPWFLLLHKPVHKRLKTDLTLNSNLGPQ